MRIEADMHLGKYFLKVLDLHTYINRALLSAKFFFFFPRTRTNIQKR